MNKLFSFILLMILTGCATTSSGLTQCAKACRDSNVDNFRDDTLSCKCVPKDTDKDASN